MNLFIFVILASILVFSILTGLYWQRRILLGAVGGWFNSLVAKNQHGSGAFRDRATFSVVLRIGFYTLVPTVAWILTNNFAILFLSVFLAYKLPKLLSSWRYRRRQASMERDLPIALTMFASALSGGVSLSVAIQTYTTESRSPLSSEFAYMLRLQRLGVEFDSALEQVAQRVNLVDFELVSLAMRISKSVGGNLSETLIALGNSIQQKLIIEGKINALTSQGVMQAWVMSLLPVLVGGMLTIIQPEQMDKLYHTLPGNAVLGICIIMDYIGFKVIKKILTIDV